MSDENRLDKNRNVEQDDRTDLPDEPSGVENIGWAKLLHEVRHAGKDDWMELLQVLGRAAVGVPVFVVAAVGVTYCLDALGIDANDYKAFPPAAIFILSVAIASAFYRYGFKMPWDEARNYTIGAAILMGVLLALWSWI